MTNYRDEPPIPLEPFPVRQTETPFPPLGESVAAPAEPDPPRNWIEDADAHDLAVDHVRSGQNALLALGRFAFPTPPPLDVEGVAARDRSWTSRAVMTSSAFLLVFSTVSPLNW